MPENGLSKGKAQPAKNGQKGKGKSAWDQKRPEGKRESGPRLDFGPNPPQYQKIPSRTASHARTHARTKRNDFPVGVAGALTPQPPIIQPPRGAVEGCRRLL